MSVTLGHNGKLMAVKKSGKAQSAPIQADGESATMKRLSYLLALKQKAEDTGTNMEQMLIEVVRSGITKGAYERIVTTTGIPSDDLADMLHISPRTLRRYEGRQILPPEQSERIVEIARLYSRGEEVFGDLERFKEWMGRPQLVFGRKSPTSLLDTSIGIGMITDELGRIEHGIFV